MSLGVAESAERMRPITPSNAPNAIQATPVPRWVTGQAWQMKRALVIGGVDTHKHTHHAAVIDSNGQFLGDRQFGTDAAGEAELVAWLRSHGEVASVGVEGTGSYGASRLAGWLRPVSGLSR